MGKTTIKMNTKLDLVAPVDGKEVTLKSTFLKATGSKWQLANPILDGKALALPPGTPVVLSWIVEDKTYRVDGLVFGLTKQGIRTFLVVTTSGDPQSEDRRAFTRVTAELKIEISNFETNSSGERIERIYAGITCDISNGGTAIYSSAPMAVGETVSCTIARAGSKKIPLKALVCWVRPSPPGTGFKSSAGLQFAFSSTTESAAVSKLTTALAAKQH